jgi:thiamine biosynthesis lipoprotein
MMCFNYTKFYGLFKRSSVVLLLFCLFACSPENEINEYSLSGQTMGTVYNIKLVKNSLDRKLLKKIKTAIDSSLEQVNQQMSTYIPISEISGFNNFKDTLEFNISNDFSKVINAALKVYQISSGAFDITVSPLVNLWGFGSKSSERMIPSDEQIESVLKLIGSENIKIIDKNTIKKGIAELEIDLNAIAKGYGVDVVSQTLEMYKQENYMIEIGGEVYAKGKNINKKKWKIGIDKPQYLTFPGQDLQSILNISNKAVATSGDYRNYFEYENKIYSHTINPKTGKPVTHNLASVTIVAPNCMQADALATAVLVMGVKKGLKLLESLENVEGYLISRVSLNEFKADSTTGFGKYLN